MAYEKPTSIENLDKILKDIYLDNLDYQLSREILVFGNREFEPYKPTLKQRIKEIWNHIPDFIKFVRSYEYVVWSYKE
jgi:hypothetical protein